MERDLQSATDEEDDLVGVQRGVLDVPQAIGEERAKDPSQALPCQLSLFLTIAWACTLTFIENHMLLRKGYCSA
jgi:hypothetical protein